MFSTSLYDITTGSPTKPNEMGLLGLRSNRLKALRCKLALQPSIKACCDAVIPKCFSIECISPVIPSRQASVSKKIYSQTSLLEMTWV